MRTTGEQRLRVRALRERILQLYALGRSANRVGRELNISGSAVRAALKAEGVDIRATPGMSDEDRFWHYCSPEPNTGCWIWIGAYNGDGYGCITIGRAPNRKVLGAHNFAYQIMVGAVRKGYELDHLCRNRWCCNPGHLELVTKRENLLRSNAPPGRAARGEDPRTWHYRYKASNTSVGKERNDG